MKNISKSPPCNARRRPLRNRRIAIEAARATYIRSLRRSVELAHVLQQVARGDRSAVIDGHGRPLREAAADWVRYTEWLLADVDGSSCASGEDQRAPG
jgi:hypothetical protein